MDHDDTTDAAASGSEGARQGSTATTGATNGAGRGSTATAGATDGAGEGSVTAGATDTGDLLQAVRSVVQQELHAALARTGTGGGERHQPQEPPPSPDHLRQLH